MPNKALFPKNPVKENTKIDEHHLKTFFLEQKRQQAVKQELWRKSENLEKNWSKIICDICEQVFLLML